MVLLTPIIQEWYILNFPLAMHKPGLEHQHLLCILPRSWPRNKKNPKTVQKINVKNIFKYSDLCFFWLPLIQSGQLNLGEEALRQTQWQVEVFWRTYRNRIRWKRQNLGSKVLNRVWKFPRDLVGFFSHKEFTSKWPFRTKAWTQESTAIETQKAGAWKIDFSALSSKNDILLDRARLSHVSVLK